MNVLLLEAIVISALLSAVLTFLVMRFAISRRWLAPVRDRDSHSKVVPRIGGVAIFGSFFIMTLLYQAIHPEILSQFGFPFAIFGVGIDKRLLALLTGTLVITASMVIDDIKGLKPYQKLALQILGGLIIIIGGVGVDYINNPFGGHELRLDVWKIPVMLGQVTYHFVVIADILTVIWLVLLMNVLNFADGIDGLAATISGIALFVLMLLSLRPPVTQPATALIAAISFGVVIGFLLWNAPPAKIFMGDSGSMFLGFLIGVLAIIAGAKFATTVIVLALPILDALWVIIYRLYKGYNPFTHPDQNHLHHRFLKAGFSVRQTLVIMGGISLLFGLAALQNSGKGKILLFGLAIVVLVALLLICRMMELRKSA